MYHLATRLSVSRLWLLMVIIIGLSAVTQAQVVYDWKTKTLDSSPTIHRTQTVRFRITNVNDILFKYTLDVTQTPIASDGEWALIKGFLGIKAQPGTSGAGCDVAGALGKLKAAADAIDADQNLPAHYINQAPPSTSIPLQTSVDAWKKIHDGKIQDFRNFAVTLESNPQCNGVGAMEPFKAAREAFEATVKSIEDRVNSSHEFVKDVRIEAGNNVSAVVREMFGDKEIDKRTFSFSGVDVLTLSAGALFTRIPDRSYESRKTPDSTTNVLTVEGNSRATPGVVALLNYSLGRWGLDSDSAGLALSAGPVVRFGKQGTSSSFGFFTGISGHLHHKIYFTPGFHFGEFADFPVGFKNGSPVPANFGELNPVKRWTTRFGLAITFKTKDFNGLSSSSTVTASGNSGTDKKTSGLTPKTNPGTGVVASSIPSTPQLSSPATATDQGATASVARIVATVNSFTERPMAPSPTADLVVPSRTSAAAFTIPVVYDAPVRSSTSSIHILSLRAAESSADRDRVVLMSNAPVNDYKMYFRDGRFFIAIPHATFDGLQDGSRGSLFRDPMIERHNDTLVLSFAVALGTTVRIVEKPTGLDLLLALGGRD